MRHYLRTALLLPLLLACAPAAHADDATQAFTNRRARSTIDSAVGFEQRAVHSTVAVIEDVTDPTHPQTLWTGDNLIGQCGIRNLMALLSGQTNMGAASGAANTLGTRCAGLDDAGRQKVPCKYSMAVGATIKIGAAGVLDCVATGNPWPCCTQNVQGCGNESGLDVLLFTEGQPNNSLVGVQSNFQTFLTNGSPNLTSLTLDAEPTLYWDGATAEGIQFVATADGSTANHKWAEYAVRSGNSTAGCGPLSATYPLIGTVNPGWQLNHALIIPSLIKSAGQVWRITITITFV